MSMGVIPEDGKVSISFLQIAGRQVRAGYGSGEPVAWISNRNVPSPGSMWTDLSGQSGETGLQPFLLGFLQPLMDYPSAERVHPVDEPGRPWDTSEVGDPVDTALIDSADPAALLAGWWYWDEEDREALTPMFAPFGARFPGLAPATTTEIDPELRRRALDQYTRNARIGLVPAGRPADILARVGWNHCANASREVADVTTVLRSWEDRFGARLFEVGFDSIRLLVSRPPRTLEEALPIAAEHFVFSDTAHAECQHVSDIAAAIVDNPFWDFWWD
jgi:hypothetical protein